MGNISLDNVRFASVIQLEMTLVIVDKLGQTTFDVIPKTKEMNIVYLFRDGNGRSVRI